MNAPLRPLLPPLPRVIGHRGAALHAPENTLASMDAAAALGADWVEFDARLTACGAAVLLHDADLARTTNGCGLLVERALHELADLDAGSWFAPGFASERIPTLEQALDRIAALGLGANVEMKPTPGLEEQTGRLVAGIAAARWPVHLPPLLLSSEHPDVLRGARAVAPHLARALVAGALPPGWAGAADELGLCALVLDHLALQPEAVAEVRAAGLAVCAYTVNDVARAALLHEWGVAAVFSDDPAATAAGEPSAPAA